MMASDAPLGEEEMTEEFESEMEVAAETWLEFFAKGAYDGLAPHNGLRKARTNKVREQASYQGGYVLGWALKIGALIAVAEIFGPENVIGVVAGVIPAALVYLAIR